MPQNQVSDPITDQEMAFAHLVLSGTMTDRRAAEAVGLNPDTAAYTKSKPRVRAYMLEHRTRISRLVTPDTATCAAFIKESRMESANANQPNRKSGGAPDSCLVTPDTATCAAFIKESRMESANANQPNRKSGGAAVREQLVQQETEGLRQLNLGREQVLARLWEIANLAPEMTRSSITGQIKALAMIVAIEGLIPDRRAGSAEKQSAPPPPKPKFYVAQWLRERQAKAAAGVQPSPDLARDEDGPGVPDPSPGAAPSAPSPVFNSSEFNFVHPSETVFDSAPDTSAPFSIKKKLFARRY
jgi:hypothetical protein